MAQLNQRIQTALFAGQVMQMNAIENEIVSTRQVLLVLAVTIQWFVEPDDLNEMEIV